MREMHLPEFTISCVLFAVLAISSIAQEDRQLYIVYMGTAPKMYHSSLLSKHVNMLREVVDSRFVEQSLVRSYTRSLNGFAAYLTPDERQKLSDHADVVWIIPSGYNYQRQTTKSWDFMGLPINVKRKRKVESDVIIGVIDGGIWPESESFNDDGFGPPPKKWKGVCDGGPTFTCNNKIIGARFYDNTNGSARDLDGHGTACASIAAGNYVKGASFYGIAKGTARGGVPLARIAVYKACSDQTYCNDANILAAFDDAIADGVDIISISITSIPDSMENSTIAIGSLHATQKGILVVQAAGNHKWKGTVRSVYPWVFSIGASTTDRRIVSRVVVKNGSIFTGVASNPYSLVRSGASVVFGSEVSRNCSYADSFACYFGCIEPNLVKGKILLCSNDYRAALVASESGAAGVIGELQFFAYAASFPIPATFLPPDEFKQLLAYFNATKSREANILASELVKNPDAPHVAGFSSRGPNKIFPDILKPDVTAPGVEILAANSPIGIFSQDESDTRSVKFRIAWGTSFSCPHVAGASAYVKSFHPKWSPASIKSALMTTTKRMDSTKDSLLLAEFAYGAGHINPIKAIDPGLVYDTPIQDYIKVFCSLGYNITKLSKLFGDGTTCSINSQVAPKDINYPTIARRVNTNQSSFSERFLRSVTNVGPVNSTYYVTTSSNADYDIKVTPNVLTFGLEDKVKSFEVVISGKLKKKMISTWLEWSDDVHRVWSPIVVYLDTL